MQPDYKESQNGLKKKKYWEGATSPFKVFRTVRYSSRSFSDLFLKFLLRVFGEPLRLSEPHKFHELKKICAKISPGEP